MVFCGDQLKQTAFSQLKTGNKGPLNNGDVGDVNLIFGDVGEVTDVSYFGDVDLNFGDISDIDLNFGDVSLNFGDVSNVDLNFDNISDVDLSFEVRVTSPKAYRLLIVTGAMSDIKSWGIY